MAALYYTGTNIGLYVNGTTSEGAAASCSVLGAVKPRMGRNGGIGYTTEQVLEFATYQSNQLSILGDWKDYFDDEYALSL